MWHGCWMSNAARSLTASPEPARPEGLGTLSPALASFVDVFGLDRDLVAVAAEGAPTIAPPIRHPGLGSMGAALRAESTSHCSRAWLVATGAWAPRFCVGFDGMHRAADQHAATYGRRTRVERKQRRRNGAKPLATVRLANVNGASENRRPPGNDT